MATTYLHEGDWTDSSGTEVGSEFSEGRRSLRPNQVFHPPSYHHFRSGLSMELEDSTWQLEQHELERCLIGYVADVRRFVSYIVQMHVNDLWNLEGSVHVQLYGLPLECFTEEAGFSLGRAVGEVVKVDIDSLMPRNIWFLRLKVWVSLDRPVISGFFLKFRDGQQHWISCDYERLCKVCRNCGRVCHTITTCSISFEEAQQKIDANLQDIGRRLHSQVMIQDTHPMYSASIRANAHRPDRRTTRIFQNTTNSHMEIPKEVGPSNNGHNANMDADFAVMWERDWDTGLQQGTPGDSETSLPALRRDGVLPPASSLDTRPVASNVLLGLGQVPVDLVGELKVMWNQWEGQLSLMGIRPGQLVIEGVGELTASPRQAQQNYPGASSINGIDQASLSDSNEDVLRALQINGPSLRLNIPMGEAPIIIRAFTRASPRMWTNVGSVTFEVGQTSSMMENGPQSSTLVAKPSPLSPPLSIQSGLQ
ncbi:hypothetical protein LOK49_LG02G00335 [Camellia lanceoleosa]|uniref:Uncharacterized protein n=1 Tax=Camellia lanceoleosa TaxID=1840588 RepID=A0ACC0IK17_9ERIC|nr:hypothetical protein LOK49_LG02G00335 [Camellia lanceoleosa]